MTTEWMMVWSSVSAFVLVAASGGGADDPIVRLFAAVRAGDAAAVQALLESDAALANGRNADQVSAVMMAMYVRHHELVPIFERHGAALDVFAAAAAGRVDRLRELVGADRSLVNGYSGDGFPVLALAAFFGQRDAVAYLLTHGADVNAAARNKQHVTALHAAIAGPDPEIARLLVDRGADVTARQEAGYTALHEVASKGLIDLAGTLIAAGADAGAKNDAGVTPYDLAVKNHHDALAALLGKGKS